jgi:serine/threonine-protein kinase
MAEDMKVIPRGPQTSTSTSARTRITGRLPDDLLADQVQRLAVTALVGAGLWTFALSMATLVLPYTADPILRPTSYKVIEVIGLLGSLAMFFYIRLVPHSPSVKNNVGLGFMLINAAAVAMLNTWALPPTTETMRHLSWNAIVILVFAMIVPTSPRRMLAATLAAASTDPIGVGLAALRGVPVPSVLNTIAFCLPTYICAIVATLPSHVFHRLGSRLREAQELGSYRLIERLGQGGMGEVWRAEHQMLARSAAIKLVRPALLGAATAADAKIMLRRFEREAKATAALASPHTIGVFDFGVTDEGSFYYVMELLAGRDLESLVRDFGPLPANRAVFLLRQVCHSLADAHARGLVHRDVKPANIYVCRMGLEYDFVKVLDFGLVKVKNRATTDQTLMTVNQATTGTPAYMAPEIILGEGDVDRRADVYAVGCVAYYLLTGQLVFEADTSMKMLLQHVHAQPIPPSQRSELDIPRELDEVVLACLQKDPNLRPQNAEELFRLVCRCQHCFTWEQPEAKRWWEMHLPEFTGPLTLTETVSGNVVQATSLSR